MKTLYELRMTHFGHPISKNAMSRICRISITTYRKAENGERVEELTKAKIAHHLGLNLNDIKW